jgi:hypothetical protein
MRTTKLDNGKVDGSATFAGIRLLRALSSPPQFIIMRLNFENSFYVPLGIFFARHPKKSFRDDDQILPLEELLCGRERN